MNEFDLIDLILEELRDCVSHPQVVVESGDDAGVVQVPDGFELAVTTDVLTEGVHFPNSSRSDLVGYRALAVNFSDLAAMGATPFFHTIALTLNSDDLEWIRGFAHGVATASAEYDSVVLGGNLSKGPLSIAVTAHGLLPKGKALRRDGAQLGDDVWVSGRVGATNAFLGGDVLTTEDSLAELLDRRDKDAVARYFLPIARTQLGSRLLDIANCAIDVSDGLLAEVGHIVSASKCGAQLHLDDIPIWPGVRPIDAIGADDSYELVFTAAPNRRDSVRILEQELDVSISRIGEIDNGSEVRLYAGQERVKTTPGYSHF